jgi:hypothetical protein
MSDFGDGPQLVSIEPPRLNETCWFCSTEGDNVRGDKTKQEINEIIENELRYRPPHRVAQDVRDYLDQHNIAMEWTVKCITEHITFHDTEPTRTIAKQQHRIAVMMERTWSTAWDAETNTVHGPSWKILKEGQECYMKLVAHTNKK